ncbi:hypothetical protein SNE40_013610 [Patella caerulea]|uniref:Ubiquitin-like domain-containing protein n=1 Tax=Patella caerulea TaxID=87958 RepID=A0AAN8JJN4_PATCE
MAEKKNRQKLRPAEEFKQLQEIKIAWQNQECRRLTQRVEELTHRVQELEAEAAEREQREQRQRKRAWKKISSKDDWITLRLYNISDSEDCVGSIKVKREITVEELQGRIRKQLETEKLYIDDIWSEEKERHIYRETLDLDKTLDEYDIEDEEHVFYW